MLFRRYDIVVALLFFVTTLIWSQNIPLFEAPDEYSHYRHAAFIAKEARLPNSADLADPNLWEGFQPPLYYVLVAGLIDVGVASPDVRAIVNPDRDPYGANSELNWFDQRAMKAQDSNRLLPGVYWLRALNSLFGALLILTCFRLMREVGAERSGALLIAIWSFVPAVVFSCSTMTNDVLAALLSVFGLVQYQLYRNNRTLRPALISGVCFGLGMMTKTNVLFLWAPLLVLEALQTPRFRFTKERAALLVLPIVISSLSVIRSLSLHSVMDPDPHRLAWINSSLFWQIASWPLSLLKTLYWTVATSVGVLGPQTVWLPGWIYGLYGCTVLLVLLLVWNKFRANNSKLCEVAILQPVVSASWFATIALLIVLADRFRESGETMHARLLLAYVPGIIAGFALATRGIGPSPFQVFRSRKILFTLCIVAVLSLVFIFNDGAVEFAATQIKSSLNLRNTPANYVGVIHRALWAAVVSAGILIFAVPFLGNGSLTKLRWESLVILLASTGALLNIAMLFLFIVPRFSF